MNLITPELTRGASALEQPHKDYLFLSLGDELTGAMAGQRPLHMFQQSSPKRRSAPKTVNFKEKVPLSPNNSFISPHNSFINAETSDLLIIQCDSLWVLSSV